MTKQNKTQSGFSLVEIAVVLVIIGFIIAGVMSGQALIKTARLNGQIQQFQQYNAAFNTFVAQYGYSPGDLPNATTYFTGDVAVLDGNGNGMINDTSNRGCINDDVGGSNCAINGEKLQFFLHLYKAGLVKEKFDGSSTFKLGYPALVYDNKYGFITGSYYRPGGSTFGMNVGSAKFSYAGPYVIMASITGGADLTTPWGAARPDIFIPKDLYNIDKKIDDGLYDNGRMIAYSCDYSNCVSSGNYNLAYSSAGCVVMYKLK